MQQDHGRRFSGIARLYGEQGLDLFTRAHVLVIGVGGVGSWAVESLARSAVGRLTLIDLDHLAESNINRQLPALDSTLGQAKVLALKARIAQINAACEVECIEAFINSDNLQELLGPMLGKPASLVIDCIDHARTKAALIAWCRRNRLPIITVGGAGACLDPQHVRIGDLSRTEEDNLLSRTRRHLRGEFGYPRNLKRRFSVPAVYSNEKRVSAPPGACATDRPAASGLNCAGYGSVVHVTASMGFIAAGKALDMLRAMQSAPDNERCP